jgi:hypothetical protein
LNEVSLSFIGDAALAFDLSTHRLLRLIHIAPML